MTSNLRKAARGRECQIRLPATCNFDPSTSVLAHLNGAGMGMKHHDIHASIACSKCHDVVDGRVKSDYEKDFLELCHLQGVIRTQQIWLKEGLM